MAIGRILFAAHDGDAIQLTILFEAGDALAKESCLSDAAVEDVPIGVVKRPPLRPPAQFLTHVAVLNPPALNGILNLRVVEVRHIPRKGLGPNIYEHLYGVPLQEAQKGIEGMVRVADGVDTGRVRGAIGAIMDRVLAHAALLANHNR